MSWLHVAPSARQAQGQKIIQRGKNGAYYANAHVSIIGYERHETRQREKANSNAHIFQS